MGFFLKTNYSKKYNKQKQKITKFLSKKIKKYKNSKKLGNFQTAQTKFYEMIETHQQELAAKTNKNAKRNLLKTHLKNLKQSNAYKKYKASKYPIFRAINNISTPFY